MAAQLSNRVRSYGTGSLSALERECAKFRLLDGLSCMTLGAPAPSTVAARRFATAWAKATGRSSTIGTTAQLPAPWAAFVNSVALHAWEFDDAHARSSLQPGSVIVPVVLALGEEQDASGEEILRSILAGYEVMLALGVWLAPHLKRRGFHPTAVLGPVGAAASMACLRSLSEDETSSSLTAASSFGSGLLEFVRADCNINRVHPAHAAHSGMMATELSGYGFTGPREAFEGRWGMAAAMTSELGRQGADGFDSIASHISEVGTKPYPTCRITHASIDAAIHLRQDHDLSGDCVRDVNVWVSKQCLEQADNRTPTSVMQRQFSVQFGVALGLLTGSARLRQLRDEPVDGAVARLANRVRLHETTDSSSDEREAVLRVVSREGASVERRVACPSGEPARSGPRREDYDLVARRLEPSTFEFLKQTIQSIDTTSRLDSLWVWMRDPARHRELRANA